MSTFKSRTRTYYNINDIIVDDLNKLIRPPDVTRGRCGGVGEAVAERIQNGSMFILAGGTGGKK